MARPPQATRKKPKESFKQKNEAENYTVNPHLREAVLISSIAMSGLILATLLSFQNIFFDRFGGKIGSLLAENLFDFFGIVSYLLPAAIFYSGWIFFQAKIILPAYDYKSALWRFFGFLLSLIGANSLISVLCNHPPVGFSAGGFLGDFFSQNLVGVFGYAATSLIVSAFFLIGIILFTSLSWLKLLDTLGHGFLWLILATSALIISIRQFVTARKIKRALINPKSEKPIAGSKLKKMAATSIPPEIKSAQPVIKPSQRATKDRQQNLFQQLNDATLPSLGLLDPPAPPTEKKMSVAALEKMSREVEARLLDFNVEVQVVEVHPGPVITRFEMQLAAGLKVSKISGLAKDLARSLSVTRVRIVDVIPGKTTVGLEIPNEDREVVRLSEVLSSQQYDQARSMLSLALGKDIAGHPVIVDLAKMPHLLVAGTTGSGKSVGVNAMILSLLFKATPAEVRMIMIDPKMLELSIYEGIPHLLTPVVTDMKEAANALRWCVAEMERRYKLLSLLGVRNLASYNQKIKESEKAGKPLLDPLWRAANFSEPGGEEPATLTCLPFIVVVIDEFADMMMVVGKKVEELIARIAQKARAAGIHMILATQRPSVDVITGLIKANIPARLSFQVSSRIDSRTILDQQGAEQLLGNGDMLYLTPGSGLPIRVHGAFVSDQEVHQVVADWKSRAEPEYIEQITQTEEASESLAQENSEADPLYDQAVKIVIESRKASISNIQRRLKIGYNRAARLVEAMEAAGLVSAMESNGNREILIPAQD
jgi:S-DNA-T family DNA segregation ATPase FtsK/SpoIIIE